ncbi:hypothetical protein XabCFBP2524_14025 [Xanthomonas axonopodis pv. begoniae]|nr:hypothetical protein XabCFBP2524_14025 [Xanthomonas axonopodis pv. begoniae]
MQQRRPPRRRDARALPVACVELTCAAHPARCPGPRTDPCQRDLHFDRRKQGASVRARAGSSALVPPRMIVQLRTMLFSACAFAKCDKT